MWDFSIGRTLGVMASTWPFILLRLVVYFLITLGFMLATGAGAGIGWGAGHISSDPESPVAFAVWGGIGGFSLSLVAMYWIREYLLYVLKAGHIAVMVHLLDGRPVPGGQGQIAYAQAEVKARFLEANVLFAVDQLIKGVIAVITRLLGGIAAIIPIPGLDGLVRFVNTIIRLALTYIDEIVLAYNIRLGSSEPFGTARDGVILYAQNGTTMIKNAIWLAVISWGLTLVIFLLLLAPAAAFVAFMPGQAAGWSVAVAVVFAWALRAALLEPFCVAALMQVYFRAIEGQKPDAEWDRRLTDASRHFRELTDKAADAFRARRTPFAAPAGGHPGA
jgi:hypothetical protein